MSRPAKKAAPRPMMAAFPVAERLAAAAVRDWAIDPHAMDDAERNNSVGAVYTALVKAAKREPYNADDDAAIDLFNDASDAGYLYGLAMGLALRNGA